MKKYIDILEEIRETQQAIEAAKTQEKELLASYVDICNLKERCEARKAVENDMLKVSEERKDLQIAIKILKNNARIALFNEVVPVALEILAKYSGKPYGEKTRQKISDEVKAATNCRFYINSHYSSICYDVYPVDDFGNDYDICCGIGYVEENKTPLLIDNKIQLVTFDEIELYNIAREYVDDIPQRVKDIKAAHAEAVEKQRELKAACDRFNALVVGDIEHIQYNSHIYANMTI